MSLKGGRSHKPAVPVPQRLRVPDGHIERGANACISQQRPLQRIDCRGKWIDLVVGTFVSLSQAIHIENHYRGLEETASLERSEGGLWAR